MNLEQIKTVVLDALRAHLAPSVVKDVLLFSETDSDGEPILRFQVVVDGSGPDLSPEKIFFATGVVRDALDAAEETRFPLLTFPSSDELAGVAA